MIAFDISAPLKCQFDSWNSDKERNVLHVNVIIQVALTNPIYLVWMVLRKNLNCRTWQLMMSLQGREITISALLLNRLKYVRELYSPLTISPVSP